MSKRRKLTDSTYVTITSCDHNVNEKSSEEQNGIVDKLKKLLNEPLINTKEIFKLQTVKDALIFCKLNKLNGQVTGCLMEKFIIQKFNMKKNCSSNAIGDAVRNNDNIEIKVSIGGKTHINFNFVQIRLDHNIDYYLFVAYLLTHETVDSLGEEYIFYIPKNTIKELVMAHGSYAHGVHGCSLPPDPWESELRSATQGLGPPAP